MLLLCWSPLLLCLCLRAENVAVIRAPGENVTLRCSLDGCARSAHGYVGMYLYRYAGSREEVLYYHGVDGADKVSARGRYTRRVEKQGSLRSHGISIRELTARDSGVYSCVYKQTPQDETTCNVYTLAVSDAAPSPASPEHPPTNPPHGDTHAWPPLALVTPAAVLLSVLLTLLFVKVLVPSVKHWASSSRRARSGSLDPSEYVYEVMTKNGLQAAAPNPYDAA
ncbi:uncharacterized protein LOC114855951 [Betta splendens]|uniref:Uncharacterized protein LOC114855951 n=1 Tax=Betta splendens TaxID=158456 RepID=A0A9W2Y063_BETSP|nr:uncharacterized protein LOC114855951 [Betta splendens]